MATTAIVTGSNSGLGLHLVKSLYSTGIYSTIVMACRNVEKAKQAITEIEQTSDVLQAKLQFIQVY
jgi:NAD(P)-dependent dehydrogenase (short-subunit alcohol dehydrogenase family)